jgi:hypothetical protein
MTDLTTQAAEPCLADDVLRGAEQIADFLFGDRRQTRKIYHIASTSHFPSFRLGAILCARKSKIIEWISAQERKNGGSA